MIIIIFFTRGITDLSDW